MKTAIFLRSYAADLKWVTYALRSIRKFVTGIDDIIICVPNEDIPLFSSLNLTRELLLPSQQGTADGYLDQQASKLIADTFTSFNSHPLLGFRPDRDTAILSVRSYDRRKAEMSNDTLLKARESGRIPGNSVEADRGKGDLP